MKVKRNRVIKSFITIVFAAALALTGTVPSFSAEKIYDGAGEPPDTTATSVILMNASNGDVLYEKNAHKKRDPASVTKILNLLVCVDELDFDETITVDKTTTAEGSTMQLANGETLTIGDIAYGMMLWSANDGAEYLGYLCARKGKGDGEMKTFCDMMNAKAKSIGAVDTKYNNPNGLNPKAVNNVTTAYDIALMLKEGMKNKRYREIIGTRQYTIPKTNKHKKRIMTNSNRCLWSDEIYAVAKGDKKALDKYAESYRSNPYNYIDESVSDEMARDIALYSATQAAKFMYKPCIGGKTGYSSTAGDCFAGVAKQGNTTIIAVILNSEHSSTKFKEAKKLWKYGFNNFKNYTAQKRSDLDYEMKVKRGSLREIKLGINEDLCVTALKGDKPSETVTTEIVLKDNKPAAPIKKGTVVGQIVAYNNGDKVASENLIALETVKKGGPLSYIGIADEDVPKFIIGLILLIIIVIVLWIYIRIRKRNRARRRKRAKRREAENRAADVRPTQPRAYGERPPYGEPAQPRAYGEQPTYGEPTQSRPYGERPPYSEPTRPRSYEERQEERRLAEERAAQRKARRRKRNRRKKSERTNRRKTDGRS